ncbi:MAG: sodium:calcium antiporter, partial [Methanosarcinales archaeon]|nr:sodium:calcium antiporter [Methanosarcinales archaeon]
TVIGLTLVALGTSLPELAVSIAAARKRWGMMVIGNVIGSNIANILLALGISAVFCTIPRVDAIVDNIVLMVFLAMAMVIFVRYRGVFDRRVGTLFVMVYVAFIAMIFM